MRSILLKIYSKIEQAYYQPLKATREYQKIANTKTSLKNLHRTSFGV